MGAASGNKTIHITLKTKDYEALKEYSNSLGLNPTVYCKALAEQDIIKIHKRNRGLDAPAPRLTLNEDTNAA